MSYKTMAIAHFACAALLFLTWCIPGGSQVINASLLGMTALNLFMGINRWEGK